MASSRLLALDIGGTSTKAAIFAGSKFVSDVLVAEPTAYKYSQFLNRLRVIARDVGALDGVGISFGVELSSDGLVVAAGKMPDFEGRHLTRDVELVFSARSYAAHDCVCGALAELGTDARNTRALAYVTVSTGIGAAIALRTPHGLTSFRSRIAHQIIRPDGRLCACGQVGCLAAYADSRQLEHRYDKEFRDIVAGDSTHSIHESLAIGLVNLSWLLPIEQIVVGGGAVLSDSKFLPALDERYRALRITGKHYESVIRLPLHGSYSPLFGAAMLHEPTVTVLY